MIFVLKKRWLAVMATCLAVLIAVLSLLTRGVAYSVASSNWGLGFHENGKTPTGNADAAFLAQYRAYYVGNVESKVIYLTFDAGYENGYTASILDTLNKQRVPATFFVVKHYVDTAPELVKQMVAEGHIVANHTATHPDMSRLSDKAAFQKELTDLEEAYRSLTGREMMKLYRPPQGKFSEENLKMAYELGYATFFWSLAHVDWYVDRQPSREEALTKLTERIHPGAIVLLHSTSQTNAAILEELITRWRDMGYTFASLDTLVADDEQATLLVP